jgi:hypothetical protein
MNPLDKLTLHKMIDANNVQDVTEEIRQKNHSKQIRADVDRMLNLKRTYSRLALSNPHQFDAMCVSQCNFLFNNYTDMFNKVKKDELNIQILGQLLDILGKIEEGKLDQHAGAYEVGKLLKEMYIDSALIKAERLDKKTGKKTAASKPKEKKISWAQFKETFG